MSEELIPCPFCGESSRVEINTYTEQIVCGQCGAVVYYKYWDTRPIEDELRARIAELEEKQRWIPVSERLPEAKGHYMAVVVDGFDDSRSVETLRYFGDGDWFTWSDWYVVTHWKEEPELPEVQE